MISGFRPAQFYKDFDWGFPIIIFSSFLFFFFYFLLCLLSKFSTSKDHL